MMAEKDDILHASIDEELSAYDQRRLEVLVAESPETARRLSAYRRVAAWLTELGYDDPPPTLVSNVMRQVERLAGTRGPAHVIPIHFGGARTMMKKVMYGIAAAAAIVLVVFGIWGYPPVGKGTEGAIGAAKRYQGQQLSDKDVKLGDTTAQAFLQSDTFARLLKDPAALKLLSDPVFLKAINDQAVIQALQDKDVSAALRVHGAVLANPNVIAGLRLKAFTAMIKDDGIIQALETEAFAKELFNLRFINSLNDPGVVAALDRHNLDAALTSGLEKALAGTELLAQLRSHGATCTACLAIESAQFRLAVQQPQILALVQNTGLIKAIGDASFVNALTNGNLVKALDNEGFFQVVADLRLTNALQAGVLQAAFNSGLFMAVKDAAFAKEISAGIVGIQGIASER